MSWLDWMEVGQTVMMLTIVSIQIHLIWKTYQIRALIEEKAELDKALLLELYELNSRHSTVNPMGEVARPEGAKPH